MSKFSYTIKNSWIQTTTRRNIYTGTIILANRWRRVYFREFLIWAGSFQEFLIWAGSFREFLILAGQVAERPETNRFFGGFYPVLFSFFVSRHSLWTWHGYFEKKLDLACFFWHYRQLKQKSAAPQGSPPPTQQIKIQMQISWVGRSTRLPYDDVD